MDGELRRFLLVLVLILVFLAQTVRDRALRERFLIVCRAVTRARVLVIVFVARVVAVLHHDMLPKFRRHKRHVVVTLDLVLA